MLQSLKYLCPLIECQFNRGFNIFMPLHSMGPRKISAKWRCPPNSMSIIGGCTVLLCFVSLVLVLNYYQTNFYFKWPSSFLIFFSYSAYYFSLGSLLWLENFSSAHHVTINYSDSRASIQSCFLLIWLLFWFLLCKVRISISRVSALQ